MARASSIWKRLKGQTCQVADHATQEAPVPVTSAPQGEADIGGTKAGGTSKRPEVAAEHVQKIDDHRAQLAEEETVAKNKEAQRPLNVLATPQTVEEAADEEEGMFFILPKTPESALSEYAGVNMVFPTINGVNYDQLSGRERAQQ